jgi:hypothetical protein
MGNLLGKLTILWGLAFIGLMMSLSVWFALPLARADALFEVVRGAPSESAARVALERTLYSSNRTVFLLYLVHGLLTFVLTTHLWFDAWHRYHRPER